MELNPRNGADWHRPGGAARQILPQEHSQHVHELERLCCKGGSFRRHNKCFPHLARAGTRGEPGKSVLGAVSFMMVHIWPGSPRLFPAAAVPLSSAEDWDLGWIKHFCDCLAGILGVFCLTDTFPANTCCYEKSSSGYLWVVNQLHEMSLPDFDLKGDCF